MHNCEECQLLLSMSQDGETTPAQEAQLNRHLEECAACRQARAALTGLGDALRGYEPPPEAPKLKRPPGLKQNLFHCGLALVWLATSFHPIFWLGYLTSMAWAVRQAWPRAVERGGRPGALEYALTPVWLPLSLLSSGMLFASLAHQGWAWQAGAAALWLGPLACVASRGLGGLRSAHHDYPMPVILLDASLLGLMVYLYSFLAWSPPQTDPQGQWLYSCELVAQCQRWLNNHLWAIPALVLAWWAVVRTPLASAAELCQGSARCWPVNALVGLPLGLVISLLLAYHEPSSLGFSIIWPMAPLAHLPLCLGTAALAGALLGLRRERSPFPERKAILRTRLAASCLGLALALAGSLVVVAQVFPGVPEPLMPRLFTPSLDGPIPDWLEQCYEKLADRKAPAARRKPALQQFQREYAKLPPQAVNSVMKLKLAMCLRRLAEDRQTFDYDLDGRELTDQSGQERTQNDEALTYYLESNRWRPHWNAGNFLKFVVRMPLTPQQCRQVLDRWDGFPAPDPLPWADYNFQEWRNGLWASPLPAVYMNFERQVGSLFYLRFRGALAHGRDLPDPQEFKLKYPTAPLSYRFACNLTESYRLKQCEWTEAEMVVIVAGLKLYRAENGRYPDDLSELDSYFSHHPRNYLQANGRFVYYPKDGSFYLDAGIQRRGNGD